MPNRDPTRTSAERRDFPTGSGRAMCMCSMHAPAPAWGLVDEKTWLAEVREWDLMLARGTTR